jgi:hypothetical protein
LAGKQSKVTEKLKNSALNMFLVVNEPEKRAEISLKKSKFQQILGNMFRAEFSSFSVSSDCWPDKKTGNWRKLDASANQIPESAEVLIFAWKIPALRARSPPETCLELCFRVFPLVLIFGQPKKSENSKESKPARICLG